MSRILRDKGSSARQKAYRSRSAARREPGAPNGLLLTADQFNQLCPIGRRVRFYPVAGEDRYEDTRTRSAAWELCGTPVVAVEGRAGGVAIDHLELLEDA